MTAKHAAMLARPELAAVVGTVATRRPLSRHTVRFGIGKGSRQVTFEVGDRYEIQPMNPRATRNRGRRCLLLSLDGKIVTMPDFAVVRYEDTNRIGRVRIDMLVPVEDNAGG